MRNFPPFLTTAAISNFSIAAMMDWGAPQWLIFFNGVVGLIAGVASILRGKKSRKKPTKGRRARVVRPLASAGTNAENEKVES